MRSQISNLKYKIVSLLLCVISCRAAALTPCQIYVIKNWPRYNFTAWSVAAMDDCEVRTKADYAPTLSDANAIAEQWLNGVHE